MFQVHEFFLKNPTANPAQAMDHFAVELELGKQIETLKSEVKDIMALRASIKPQLDRKSELDEQLRYIMIEIDTEVAMQYPPRQGSDKDRDLLRQKLKKEHAHYAMLDNEYKTVSMTITELQYRMDEVERNCKNARRLTELFDSYARFLTEYCKTHY